MIQISIQLILADPLLREFMYEYCKHTIEESCTESAIVSELGIKLWIAAQTRFCGHHWHFGYL